MQSGSCWEAAAITPPPLVRAGALPASAGRAWGSCPGRSLGWRASPSCRHGGFWKLEEQGLLCRGVAAWGAFLWVSVWEGFPGGGALWAVPGGKATWRVLGRRVCFGRLWKVPVLGWGLQGGRSCSSNPSASKPLGG